MMSLVCSATCVIELKATMSAMYARVAGTNDAQTGLPNNILIKPEAIKNGLNLGRKFETGALPTLTQAGTLGKTFEAFDSSGGGDLKNNMELRLPKLRLGDRRTLLKQLDRIRFNAEKNGTIDRVNKYRQQAFEIITRGIGEAFDLKKEDPKTIARYDTTGIFKAPDLQCYFDMKRASNLLGHQLLMGPLVPGLAGLAHGALHVLELLLQHAGGAALVHGCPDRRATHSKNHHHRCQIRFHHVTSSVVSNTAFTPGSTSVSVLPRSVNPDRSPRHRRSGLANAGWCIFR
jgi:hypothetical protein